MSLEGGCRVSTQRAAGLKQQRIMQDRMNKPSAGKKMDNSCTENGESAWGTLLRLYEDVTLGGQSVNFSRPREGEEMLLRQPLCLRRLQRQPWTLLSLCLGRWCDVVLQNWANELPPWRHWGNLTGLSYDRGLWMAAALPWDWGSCCLSLDREPESHQKCQCWGGKGKKLLSLHWHLGQISQIIRLFICARTSVVLTAMLVSFWLGWEGQGRRWWQPYKSHARASCCLVQWLTLALVK